jgi:hypothetical protein
VAVVVDVLCVSLIDMQALEIFVLTVLYGFGPYCTVTVPYLWSENGDTAYKHNTEAFAALQHPCPQVQSASFHQLYLYIAHLTVIIEVAWQPVLNE